VTTINKDMKVTKENYTTHSTDAAAVFSMETHTPINGTQISADCW
jgi:hypothetical protein